MGAAKRVQPSGCRFGKEAHDGGGWHCSCPACPAALARPPTPPHPHLHPFIAALPRGAPPNAKAAGGEVSRPFFGAPMAAGTQPCTQAESGPGHWAAIDHVWCQLTPGLCGYVSAILSSCPLAPQALQAVTDLANTPELHLEWELAPGDIQLLHNWNQVRHKA